MHKTILKYLLFTLMLILFLSVIGIIYISTLDVNDYKGFVERTLKSRIGLEVKLNGRIDLEVEDELQLHLRDVSVYDESGILFSLDSVYLTTDFEFPGDTVEIYELRLYKPFYHFRTTGIDLFSTSNSSSSSSGMKYIMVDSGSVHNGQFLLSNESDSGIVNVQGINASDGFFGFEMSKPALEAIFISASGTVNKVDAFDIHTQKARTDFVMENGYLNFNNQFDNSPGSSLKLQLNLNPDDIVYDFEGEIKNEKIKRLYEFQGLDIPDFVKGDFNAKYDFNFSVPDDTLSIRSVEGMVHMTSSDAYLKGVNLDKLIKSYRRTQNFSMKDLGSVMLLGPWGLAISKGGDYAELAMSSNKDSSHIEFMNFNLSIDTGLVQFNDVAFRTEKNRVALSGEIDIINESYHSFAYALVQDDGCPEIREEFNGPFEQAESEGPNGLKILMGPVTNLFKGTSRIIDDSECKYPYRGSVEAPIRKNIFGNQKKSRKEKKQEKKTQQDENKASNSKSKKKKNKKS